MSQPIRVLVIDDEQNVADALWHLLRMHQYEVQPFTSAIQALEAMKTQSFDVVISDLQMPDMDGLVFLTRVAEVYPGVRRMLITAYDSTLLREQIVGLVHAYLPKPFTLRSFIQVVEHQVGELRQEALRQEGDWQSQRLLHKIGARLMDRALRQAGLASLPTTRSSHAASPQVHETYAALERILHNLQADVQADIVLLADTLGQTIVEVGYSQHDEQAGLVPLISATFASITELGNLVDGQAEAGTFWYRAGERFDLYMVNINRDCYLAVLIGKSTVGVKPGVAWMRLKRAVGEIRTRIEMGDLVSTGEQEVEPSLASAIVNHLDSLFTGQR